MVLGNKRTDEQEGLLTLRNVLFLKELQGNQALRGQPGCNKGKKIVSEEAKDRGELVNYGVEIPKGSTDRFGTREETGSEVREEIE